MRASLRVISGFVLICGGCADSEAGTEVHMDALPAEGDMPPRAGTAPAPNDTPPAPTASSAPTAMKPAAQPQAAAPAQPTQPTAPTQPIQPAEPPPEPENPSADAGAASSTPERTLVKDLSDQVLATWGSSVCDGYAVPSGTAWPWLLEKNFAEIKGPKVSHASTPGHNTDSKDSALERAKIADANFVVVCLSLGNQGLGSAATEANAQAVVDSYLDDIFSDHDDSDGDPVSMVDHIKSIGAHPIVTLVYPMAGYNTMHCRHVVEANILQQSLGVATINQLGATNAGNAFGNADCTWANGRNAPINAESDARHPNQAGHDESFFAFAPDLPFALASGIPFPERPTTPTTTDYITLSDSQTNSAPVQYTPEHPMHGYTLQFSFRSASDGTLATVDLGMNGFLTIALTGGVIHLLDGDGAAALQDTKPAADDAWHDVAVTYSYVRQKLALYVDGALIGEADAGEAELFPQRFVLGGPAESARAAAPGSLQLRDLFVNRATLHAREIEERATSEWLGAGSLDVYAPLRASLPTENRAQTLQMVKVAN